MSTMGPLVFTQPCDTCRQSAMVIVWQKNRKLSQELNAQNVSGRADSALISSRVRFQNSDGSFFGYLFGTTPMGLPIIEIHPLTDRLSFHFI